MTSTKQLKQSDPNVDNIKVVASPSMQPEMKQAKSSKSMDKNKERAETKACDKPSNDATRQAKKQSHSTNQETTTGEKRHIVGRRKSKRYKRRE
jgi:hypothetical protein